MPNDITLYGAETYGNSCERTSNVQNNAYGKFLILNLFDSENQYILYPIKYLQIGS